jgi:uncharacterized protein
MIMKGKDIILQSLQDHRNELKLFGVSRLGLFGSNVRNESIESSDIDFVVEFTEGKKNFDNYISLSFCLEDIFHKKIDLVTAESLTGILKEHVNSEAEFIEIK